MCQGRLVDMQVVSVIDRWAGGRPASVRAGGRAAGGRADGRAGRRAGGQAAGGPTGDRAGRQAGSQASRRADGRMGRGVRTGGRGKAGRRAGSWLGDLQERGWRGGVYLVGDWHHNLLEGGYVLCIAQLTLQDVTHTVTSTSQCTQI